MVVGKNIGMRAFSSGLGIKLRRYMIYARSMADLTCMHF